MDDIIWGVIGASIGLGIGEDIDDLRKGRNKVFAIAGLLLGLGCFLLFFAVRTRVPEIMWAGFLLSGISITLFIRGCFLKRRLKRERLDKSVSGDNHD